MDTWQAIDQAERDSGAPVARSSVWFARWAKRMLARRPFGSREALLSAARVEWDGLSAGDWREAFSHHPKIGDREKLRQRFPATHELSSREQAGVDSVSDAMLDALGRGKSALRRHLRVHLHRLRHGPERRRDTGEKPQTASATILLAKS